MSFCLKTILYVAIIFSCLNSTVYATQIYERPDGRGGVIYSETRYQDSRPVELKEVQVFTPKLEAERDAAQTDQDTDTDQQKIDVTAPSVRPVYSTFEITSPTHEENIWNPVNVHLNFHVKPALHKDDTLHVFLDGNMIGKIKGTSLVLENLDRGTHTVYAEIVRDDAVISTTPTVTFHVHRTTITRPRPAN